MPFGTEMVRGAGRCRGQARGQAEAPQAQPPFPRPHPTEPVRRQAWKRWCTQILSALSFLHACSPPIIHGNLTSDTVFIQHNGLIKIGSGAGGLGSGGAGLGGPSERRAEDP